MADASVRPAGSGDVAAIARIQIETWRLGYVDILPAPVLDGLSVDVAAEAWAAAVGSPPSPRHRLLVALEQDRVVGFAALAPDEENAIAIGPLLVEPRWGRRGHGSRLLAAAVDFARGDGLTRAVAWVPSGDGASLSFYRSAGWDTDGYARTLDTGAGELRELRLHTSLAE